MTQRTLLKKLQNGLLTIMLEVFEWAAQNPDSNPIEHCWAVLDRKIGDWSFRKKEELKEAMTAAWVKIIPEETKMW